MIGRILKNVRFYLGRSVVFLLGVLSAPIGGMELEGEKEAPPYFSPFHRKVGEKVSLPILEASYHSQILEGFPDDLWGKIFDYLDEGRLRPNQLFSYGVIKVCPIPINDFIASGMVCQQWRKVNVSLRKGRILTISERKMLTSLSDYEAIRDSGYKTLCWFSKSVLPEDVCYLDCLKEIESVAFLPPKGTRAYTYPKMKPFNIPVEEKYLNLEVIKNIYRFNSLKILILNGNNLDVDDLEFVPNLVNIEKLDLSYNRLTRDFSLKLVSLKKMNFLRLARVGVITNITTIFEEQLPNCRMQVFL